MKKIIFASALCAMALTACQEEDFGISSKDLYKTQYNQKFENQFGKVDPNEDWDFSTRAVTNYQSVASTDGWYYVEDATLTYFQNTMKEGQDNRSKVKSFTLSTDEATTFEIVPLYQGGAYYEWDVEMLVNGQSVWQWVKGDGKLQSYERRWVPEGFLGLGGHWEYYWDDVTDSAASESQLRSTTTKVDIPAGATISFRITNHDKNNRGNFTGGDLSGKPNKSPFYSYQNPPYIGTVSLATPSNVSSVNPDYSALIITCEGYSLQPSTDPDMNDVAFLLVGYVPEVITEDEEIVTTETKRYMMEDYGAIDWDFNDVVVDVTTTTKAWYTINTETGESTIKEGTTPVTTTTAKIAHLGGTYPVQVIVGETALPLISNPTDHEQTEAELAGTSATHNPAAGGTNPGWEPENAPVAVRGYDALKNNVKLIVYKDFDTTAAGMDNGESVWESTFPTQGSVPYIVATGAHAEWTAEGVSVTSTSWWGK